MGQPAQSQGAGELSRPLGAPVVPHEPPGGVVDEVGSSLQNLAVGDRVMVPFDTAGRGIVRYRGRLRGLTNA